MRTHDYLRKRKKGENVTKQKKYPGTPTYHSTSARSGRQATFSVPRHDLIHEEFERESRARAFGVGALVGFAISAVAFAAVLWLWVMPTMNAAVEAAQGMVM